MLGKSDRATAGTRTLPHGGGIFLVESVRIAGIQPTAGAALMLHPVVG
jgi:hypothetical protein